MKTQDFLEFIGACKEGREIVGAKTLSESFSGSTGGDRLIWVAARCCEMTGWPPRAEVLRIAREGLQLFGRGDLIPELDKLPQQPIDEWATALAKLMILGAQADRVNNLTRLAGMVRTLDMPALKRLE
jgi:hypothetical protein